MKLKKKLIYILSILFISILTGACGKVPTVNKIPTSNSSMGADSSNQKQDILENGYQVDDYRFYLMNIQKDDQSLIKNIDTTIGKNFLEFKKNIDLKNKVNLIPFRANYDNGKEKLSVNYFFINNNIDEISSITINGVTNFKNITTNQTFNSSFNKEQFTLLKPKEFTAFSLTFDLPLYQYDNLKENKVSDFQLNITELEINGKKTDNINQ